LRTEVSTGKNLTADPAAWLSYLLP